MTKSFVRLNTKPTNMILKKDKHPTEPQKGPLRKNSLENLIGFNKNFICCKESRIESPTSFYGCFYLGPFDESLAQTLAHNLRRTLLSELTGLAITAVEIDGVLHQFSSIPGTKETVLDILCNLQNIVLKNNLVPLRAPAANAVAAGSGHNNSVRLQKTEPLLCDSLLKMTNLATKYSNNSKKGSIIDNAIQNPKQVEKKAKKQKPLQPKELCRPTNGITQIAYLRVRGPGIVKASDIILPFGIQSVSPDQYIATLAEDGILNMKLYITEGKNAIKQNQNSNLAYKKDPHFVLPQTSLMENQINVQSTFNNSTLLKASQSSQNQTQSNGAVSTPAKAAFDGRLSPLQRRETTKSNKIFLDSVFMPVTKVNAFVETNFKATDTFEAIGINAVPCSGEKPNSVQNIQKLNPNYSFVSASASGQQNTSLEGSNQLDKHNFLVLSNNLTQTNINHSVLHPSVITPELANSIAEGPFSLIKASRQSHIVLEIWTNGSVHPRQALKSSLNFLTTTFMTLNNVNILGSMYKSDITYKKILEGCTFKTSDQ